MPSIDDQRRFSSQLNRSASSASQQGDKTALALGVKGPAKQRPVLASGLRVTFFFDGTGNNLDAELPTQEHSNVARLFRAHRLDPEQGHFSYYVPGLGTYFNDVGDPGNEMRGNGGGYRGEDRLKWAMQKLKLRLEGNDGRQTVHLALFGFSRGAALARAFAIRVAKQCVRLGDGSWQLRMDRCAAPIRLYFMGLFDTVASVGVPMGANNTGSLVRGYGSTLMAIDDRRFSELETLAFGPAPGADPAIGRFNGHMEWASDLRIPELVEDCLHMVAAHENRNSFPVDSLLEGEHYPPNCREMVYPGVHSDVGGGYRVGEGARSSSNGAILSMIPLRVMREQAISAGVALDDSTQSQDFAEDSASQEAFELMNRRFTAYMDTVGWGGQPLGKAMLSHMERYFQWRLHKSDRDGVDRHEERLTKEQASLRPFQGQWVAEKVALSNKVETARRSYAVQAQRTDVLNNSVGAKSNQDLLSKETNALKKTSNAYFSLKARLDTMPSVDDSFLENVRLYDTALCQDALKISILTWKKGRANLRPHYLRLLNAYEAQLKGSGLKDLSMIQFFDTYVHDSLAGFAKDATLPSDPRVIYTGGDAKLPYALNRLPGRAVSQSALT